MRPHPIALAVAVVLPLLMACDPASSGSPVPPPTQAELTAARTAWQDVYTVLTHPRCANCHPDGDAPLQTDEGTPHKWGVDRAAIAEGLECVACHKPVNSEDLGIADGPPGAPNWHFPPADTPMVFRGRDSATLCHQLHDRGATGGRDLDDLLVHVANEALVLWAWNPGGDRTPPPVSHDDFLDAFAIWVQGGGACPDDEAVDAGETVASVE